MVGVDALPRGCFCGYVLTHAAYLARHTPRRSTTGNLESYHRKLKAQVTKPLLATTYYDKQAANEDASRKATAFARLK